MPPLRVLPDPPPSADPIFPTDGTPVFAIKEQSPTCQDQRASCAYFRDSDQSGSPEATGYKGLLLPLSRYANRGRVWRSELSMIDTALLIAGALTAGMYNGFVGAQVRLPRRTTVSFSPVN